VGRSSAFRAKQKRGLLPEPGGFDGRPRGEERHHWLSTPGTTTDSRLELEGARGATPIAVGRVSIVALLVVLDDRVASDRGRDHLSADDLGDTV
jgi:hypothetical protein